MPWNQIHAFFNWLLLLLVAWWWLCNNNTTMSCCAHGHMLVTWAMHPCTQIVYPRTHGILQIQEKSGWCNLCQSLPEEPKSDHCRIISRFGHYISLTSTISGNSSQNTPSFRLKAWLCTANCLFWKTKWKHRLWQPRAHLAFWQIIFITYVHWDTIQG